MACRARHVLSCAQPPPARHRRCEAWVNKPAVWFKISNHENFFHYLNDALMLVLGALSDTGLTPAHIDRRVNRISSMILYPEPWQFEATVLQGVNDHAHLSSSDV